MSPEFFGLGAMAQHVPRSYFGKPEACPTLTLVLSTHDFLIVFVAGAGDCAAFGDGAGGGWGGGVAGGQRAGCAGGFNYYRRKIGLESDRALFGGGGAGASSGARVAIGEGGGFWSDAGGPHHDRAGGLKGPRVHAGGRGADQQGHHP